MIFDHIGYKEDYERRAELANRLLSRLESSGLTVRELARKSRVSAATIAKILDPDDPTRPREKTYTRLALALDCRPGWLISGTGSPGREITEPPPGAHVCWVRTPKHSSACRGGLFKGKPYIDYRNPLEKALAAYRADDVWRGILLNAVWSWWCILRERDSKLSDYVDWLRLPSPEPADEKEIGFLEQTL